MKYYIKSFSVSIDTLLNPSLENNPKQSTQNPIKKC